MIKLITQCKRCRNDLPDPVPENIISATAFICPDCITLIEDEERERDLFKVPGMNEPYKP